MQNTRSQAIRGQTALGEPYSIGQNCFCASPASPNDQFDGFSPSARSASCFREGKAIFNELKRRWIRQVGAADIEKLESILTQLVGPKSVCLAAPSITLKASNNAS